MSFGQVLIRRALTALLVVCAASAVRAQTTGNIEGKVTDSSGSPLPGVTVEATSPNLQGARTSVTQPDGSFRFPAVAPGSYVLKAHLEGFPPVEKAATVSLDATATVDMVLQLAATEQVVVSGQAPLIDTTSTTTGTNYTSSVIAKLPVDRNYADIVLANPGVDTDRGDTEGRALALTIYGTTSAENQWVIDGVNTTNVYKGTQGKVIISEFVQEVEVKTGGYQAEYGRALGGVINVVTKSGGNVYHGGGFVYYDSAGTTAEREFQPGDTVIGQMRFVDGQRVDYGFDIGGFIVKDRLWIFGAYDRVGLQGHVSRVNEATHVSKSDRFPIDTTSNLYSGKLTWNLGPSTTIVGTVFADPSTNSGAAAADPNQSLGGVFANAPVSLDPSTWYSARHQGGTDFGIRASQLFGSQAIATLEGALHREQNSLTAPDRIRYEDWTCAGGTPEHACDFPSEPNSVTGGYGLILGFADHSVSSRWQIRGDVTLYGGNHEIKAGGDYQDGRTATRGSSTGGQLVFIQNEFGQPYYEHNFGAVSFDDPTLVPYINRRAEVRDFGVYLQDSWRAAPGLTINAGLRWDGEDTINYFGRTVLRFRDEWQPRLGIVWDPWRDGATKVYAFAGRFSYGLPTAMAITVFSNFTVLNTFNFDPVSVVQDPNVIGHPMKELAVGGGPEGDLVDAGVKAGYQDELTVGVERLLGPTLTVGLKGTYRRLGRAIEDRCDFVPSPETDNSNCVIVNPGSSGTFARGDAPTCNGLYGGTADSPWQQCGLTGPATPPARRLYRGIEVMARKTLGNRLWLQASYVYSSLRGNYDGGVNQVTYGEAFPGVNYDFNYPMYWHNGYGILSLDRTSHFRFDGSWVTPWRFSVGLQMFVESGAPLNKMGYPFVFLVPRGSAGRLPTLWEGSLTLSYPITIGPVIVTLQAYLFNLFNKQVAISRDENWSTYNYNSPENFPATIYDPNQEKTNIYSYGNVTGRYAPRAFRAALKISF
jgi:carboxypeptidase family protein/TonB-dependent receptor-like protein